MKNVANYARFNKDTPVVNDTEKEVADFEDKNSMGDMEEDLAIIISDPSEWKVSDFSSSDDSNEHRFLFLNNRDIVPIQNLLYSSCSFE